MFGVKRNAIVFLTFIILCAFLVCNIITIGVALIARNNTDLNSTLTTQNQDLILNDMQSIEIQSANSNGVVIIDQNQITVTGTFLFTSFFIYFIIATNVQDYNLFPSHVKLNQSTRQEIYTVIEQNEGVHLREICRLLDRKMGVIQYHIYVLESANLISSMKDGRYKRFFVNHRDAPEERVIISLLQRETTGKVLNLIFEKNEDGVSHSAIAKELGSSSQAVTWHIHKLTDAGIISTNKKGCQKFYQICPDFLPILASLLNTN